MKLFIKVVLASTLLVFTGAASAQIAGVVGWGQGGGALSTSGVNGVGGSGAALIGVSGTQTSAGSSNLSAVQTTQVPGTTTTVANSISVGGMQSTSFALGLAGAASGSNFDAGGAAAGGGGQTGVAAFIAVAP